jgi:hypothetical protein
MEVTNELQQIGYVMEGIVEGEKQRSSYEINSKINKRGQVHVCRVLLFIPANILQG